jgi:hypothetical protein
LPWNAPVPIRVGPFVASEPQWAVHNVVTDLARLGPYGARREPIPPSELLYADFQIVPDYCVPGRLGSGRAGHYRGRYLKGIGRTPLAANWNEPVDQAHATGHLSTWCGIRERFVTWVLEAKGLSHRINPCEALLLAPLDAQLRAHQESTLQTVNEAKEASLGAIGAFALPCDRGMQALTVKGSSFARFSNFVWLMNNMDLFTSRDAFVHFLFLFAQYLDPTRPLALGDISPESIAADFSAAVARTVDAFHDFFRAGVYFATPQNNVTMDGRFLDLDSSHFAGGPFIGTLTSAECSERLRIPRTDPVRVFGLNVLGCLCQIRIFYKLLRARLSLLPDLDISFTSTERELIAQLLLALAEAFPPDHLIHDARTATRMLLTWYREHCEVLPSAWPRLERMVASAATWRLERRLIEHVELPLERFEGVPLTAVSGNSPRNAHLEEARFLNGLLAELEAIGDMDTLFAKLEDVRGQVRAHVRPVG